MKPDNLNEVYKTLRNQCCCSCDHQYSEDGTIDTAHCDLEDTENLPCTLLRVYDLIFNNESELQSDFALKDEVKS